MNDRPDSTNTGDIRANTTFTGNNTFNGPVMIVSDDASHKIPRDSQGSDATRQPTIDTDEASGRSKNNKKGWLLTTIGIAVPGLAGLVTYLDGWQKVAEAFTSLHGAMETATGIQGLHRGVTATILGGGFAVVFLTAWVPAWNRRRRNRALRLNREEAGRLLSRAQKERVFRLDPQPAPESDDAPLTFDRADGAHKEILKWIRQTKRPVVYVTGQSGTGKSSLIGAYVVPSLSRGTGATGAQAETGVVAVIVRAFGDLDGTIREAIGEPGRVWKEPPDLSGMNARDVLERAAKRLADHGSRLVLVFDQFEEVLVGETSERQAAVPAVVLVKSLCDRRIEGVTCVLVARAEYGDAFKSLGLPERIEGDTWKNVPAFSVGQAAAVLDDGLTKIRGAKADNATMAMTLARQAEALGNVPQYVTPIALNMSGIMYEADPALGQKLAESGVNAAEGVLPTYVRGRVESGDIRDAGPAVLDQLVTAGGDRVKPMSAGVIARAVGAPEGAVETTLLTLARHGLVRRVGGSWEVSHDFLAPLLRRVLDRIKGSIWKRLRPWLPVAATLVISFVAVGMWGYAKAIQERKARERHYDALEFTNCVAQNTAERHLYVLETITTATARHLSTLSGGWRLTFNLGFGGNREDTTFVVRSLQELGRFKDRTFPIVGIEVAHTLLGDDFASALAAIDPGLKALTKLDLSHTQITDAGAVALAAKDSGLKGLTELYLDDTLITDRGAAALAAKDSGLTALITLSLGGRAITDVGAAALAAQDSGLKALTMLSLGGRAITDVGAAALAANDSGLNALTTLSLSGTQVGDAGALALAAKDSGLTALTTLDLTYTEVTDAGAAAIRKARPDLKVIH